MKKTIISTSFIFLVAVNCAGQTMQTGFIEQKTPSYISETFVSEIKDSKQNRELRAQIEQIARSAGSGRVGVAATVIETSESVEFNAGERFPMQSVYKFPIGMAVLNLVDEGKLKLDQKVKIDKNDFVGEGMHSPFRDENPNGGETTLTELLRLGVSLSDGTASDVLLKLAGGSEGVTKYLTGIGLKEIKVINTEKEIGADFSVQYKNWATPRGALALLKALHDGRGLSKESREFLLKLMVESPTGPKRIKGLLPAGTIVAHKTGTSGAQNGITAATNDIGIISLPNGKHLAIAVFVSDSPADQAAREEIIAKTALAAWNYWRK